MYSQTKRAQTVAISFLLLISLALTSLVVTVSEGAQADQSYIVRGRIDRQTASGTFPASYIRVTLYREGTNDKPLSAYTGSDGMYYIRNVMPGTYILQVWLSSQRVYKSYRIKVDGTPVTEIKPITIINSG